jgi:hypothetical protein
LGAAAAKHVTHPSRTGKGSVWAREQQVAVSNWQTGDFIGTVSRNKIQ